MRPRELGRIGNIGSFVAAFGLLWIIAYFAVISWLTSLLGNTLFYFLLFTSQFGWVMLLSGGIALAVGAGVMAGDWKRRAPAQPAVLEKTRSTVGYDATQPQMEYHIEA